MTKVGIAALFCVFAALAHAADVRISGRLVEATGVPLPGHTILFSQPGVMESSEVMTDSHGLFEFVASSGLVYRIRSKDPYVEIGLVEVVEGNSAAMGDFVLGPTPHHAGPVRISGSTSGHPSSPSIAALYVDRFEYGALHIVFRNGREFRPPVTKDQVGVGSPAISSDGRSVGWLVNEDNCCTSYPISMSLRIYTPGRRIREFNPGGTGVISGWHFVAAGKRIAVFRESLHGEAHAHHELRDVATGRLLAHWDEDADPQTEAPAWTREN